MDIDTLRANLVTLLEKGEKQPLTLFIAEHINDFPEDIRKELIMGFFTDAVTSYTEGQQAEDEFLVEAVNALEELEALKRFLEESLQLEGVRSRLNLKTDEQA